MSSVDQKDLSAVKPYVMWYHMDSSWRVTDDAFNAWGGQIEDQQGTQILDMTPVITQLGFKRAYTIGELVTELLNLSPNQIGVQRAYKIALLIATILRMSS